MAITLDKIGTITVEATDLDIRDLSANQDNIAISDGTDTLAINGDGSINAVVTGTDIDIRDLVNTQDSIAIGDETNIIDLQQMDSAFGVTSYGMGIYGLRRDADTSPVSADGDAHPLVFDDAGRLKVDSSTTLAADADDAAATLDPIGVGGVSATTASALGALSAAGDRYHLLGDLYRRTFVNDSYNIGWQTSTLTVGLTALEVGATPLAGRRGIIVQNLGNQAIYVGEDNTVTTSTGVEVEKGSSIELQWGEALNVWVISGTASQDVRVMEFA